MATRTPAVVRLRKDYTSLKRDPIPFAQAEPDPSNILQWHYIITGPPDTPYTGGTYHGLLKFPKDYPFKPPSIQMYTPSGRFQTNTRLCLSISDYHPESWNPSWSVGTILTGLISFMVGTEQSVGTTESSETSKKKFALDSFAWCINKSTPRGKKFNELFPQFIEEELGRQRERELKRLKEEAEKAVLLATDSQADTTPGKLLLDARQNSQQALDNMRSGYDWATNAVLFLFLVGFAHIVYIVIGSTE